MLLMKFDFFDKQKKSLCFNLINVSIRMNILRIVCFLIIKRLSLFIGFFNFQKILLATIQNKNIKHLFQLSFVNLNIHINNRRFLIKRDRRTDKIIHL